MNTEAYAVAWVGELGGIQYIQIASAPPELLTRLQKWPHPVLVHTTTGKSFGEASTACKLWLREHVPEWEKRFMRSPTRMRPMGVMRTPVAARAPKPKTK